MAKKRQTPARKKRLSLEDVIYHVDHMGQRLSAEVHDLRGRLVSVESRLGALEERVQSLEQLMERSKPHLEFPSRITYDFEKQSPLLYRSPL